MDKLSMIVSDDPAPQARKTAIACLDDFATKVGGALPEERPFNLLAYIDEKLIGGVIGRVFYNWLYANLVWVEEGYRGRGIGTRVMKATEERACKMNLSGIYLWTFTWSAPEFYKKLGYTQFVEFENFPPGHTRLGFYKYL